MVDIKTIIALAPQLGIGSIHEARTILLSIYNSRVRPDIRMHTILAVVQALSPTKDNDKIIWLCDKGLSLHDYTGANDPKMLLRLKKAHSLLYRVGSNLYRTRNIVLAPGWKGHALEKDKVEYDELTENIQLDRKEAADLYRHSEEYSSPDNRTQLSLLLQKGEYLIQTYLNYKMEIMKPTKTRILLKGLTGQELFLYSRRDQKVLARYLKICEGCMDMAIKQSDVIGDELFRAEVFAAYGNHLASALHYRKAHSYVMKALRIAKASENPDLLARIVGLNRSIDRQRKSGRRN